MYSFPIWNQSFVPCPVNNQDYTDKRYDAFLIFIVDLTKTTNYVCVCMCVYIYVCVYIYIYVCVCVCVCIYTRGQVTIKKNEFLPFYTT